MEILSPRSSNIPPKPRTIMKKTKVDPKPKTDEKPTNPDRVDDKWRPPHLVTEPGPSPETYAMGRKLGKGGFAVCFEGKTKSTSQLLALKVVKAHVEQKKMMEKFRTELQIHAKMQHPNIVQFLRAFTSEQYTYVVLELCPNGNLTDMVKARTSLSLPEVRRFMIQICGGVKYMHRRSVIHRDLKMGNIFLDQGMNIKIGDFGLAAVMADEQDRRTTLCGTPNYIAPEILSKSGSRGHDNKVDTWAVGVICYAMLIGTPPFQSKTQQEIYSKLRTLEYEWKVDSQNYIPQQAKDFVASCLNLVSSERPEMDELVDHEFFTMGAIADTLDFTCLKVKPTWLENADPRGDRVIRGYGIDHSLICKDCGVGRSPEGRLRAAIGGKATVSTLVEIEIENRRGCAPVVPLPEGTLYKHFAEAQEEWTKHQKHPLQPMKPRNRKAPTELATALNKDNRCDEEMPNQKPLSILNETLSHPVIAMRPVQSFAAQQRQQALPSRPIPESKQLLTIPTDQSSSKASETPTVSSNGLLRMRPVRAASTRVTRSTNSQVSILPSKTLPKSATLPVIMRASEDADYAATVQSERHDTRMSQTKPVARAEVGDLGKRSIAAFSNTRTNVKDRIVGAAASGDVVHQARHLDRASVKHSEDSTQKEVQHTEVSARTRSDSAATDQQRAASVEYIPRIISPFDPFRSLPCTSSADHLRILRAQYEVLGAHGLHMSSSTSRNKNVARKVGGNIPYPRVDKWVDYATRHGIAYILTDGTLGMILKSSEDRTKPSSCVVVRNARTHTVMRAKGFEEQYVPQGASASDVEFYEQCSPSAEMKRLDVPSRTFLLDTQKYSSQVSASNAILATLNGSAAERMREVSLLDKFGKYMNKQIGNADIDFGEESNNPSSDNFIHFYQRLGNVGVWRFSDGGVQFNFPDHTKLTLYHETQSKGEGNYLVDLVHLQPKDAKDLAEYGLMTSEGLERRALMTLELRDILSDSLRRVETEIVRSNEIKEKLSWIRAVIGCWIREGGIGRMGEEKLGWSGLQERRDDKRVKLQWVTVGRLGGDNEGSASK